MARSKIFSGDLPELLDKIMRYCNDISTLYSCILVNRTWCRIAIPLLWEDPFSPHDHRIIDCHLRNSSENDKMKLKEYGIKNDLSSNTLFNYPSFIKCLDTQDLLYCINKWVASTSSTLINSLNSTRLIYKLLFKIFIENEANLHTFKVEIGRDRNLIELILQNSNFINNVKNLIIQVFPRNADNLTKTEKDTIIEHTSHMINSQKNLKKINFRSIESFLYDSLLSLKNSNCSNTLKTIMFYNVNFGNILILKEVFEHLNVLESIHMIYCRSLNSGFIQQINNINKPFKLRSLFIGNSRSYQINSIQLLLQKSGIYLENFGFNFEYDGSKKILKLITKYCTRIKFLELPGFINRKIYSVFDLIKSIGQNLNYLDIIFHGMYIDYYGEELTKISSTILKSLGKFLPLRIKYLHLFLYDITAKDFEIFLRSSHKTFIEKLLINYIKTEDKDILPNLLDKYIIKRKRVRYLGFIDDLFYLEEEYKSYNVIIKDYYDLVHTGFYDCINEWY
ncbi:hypothetical protein RhiirA4_469598 [Rhizophagus irregularis]|uniref:Uncharacterized protein n=1 Tax=Rhizophagus irregularis TaxID=588596 RepID=A0A2I1GZT4_9GLOM|nr:hypothetical protein RhiirA4_469598 [Rhizophagus irregularis]